jgi:uncharacterized protein YjdB
VSTHFVNGFLLSFSEISLGETVPLWQKGEDMKKILRRGMKKRCLSLLIVSTLVVCTPATDSGLFQSGVMSLVPKAQAATGQIDGSHLLDSEIVADSNLLTALKKQIGKGDSATVMDLRRLTEITVPSDVTDLEGLGYATGVEKLDLSSCAAKSIAASEFANCESLEEVILPPGLESIGKNAFTNCNSLTTIDLSGVSSIGDLAFSGCSALTDDVVATMKDTMKELGTGVFSSCSKIETAKVPAITSGDNVHKVPAQMFNGCSSLTNVIFCDSQLNSISDQAFAYTGKLTFGKDKTNQIPATVESIGNFAFANSKLESLDLSLTSLKRINEDTFKSCRIKEIAFPDTLTEIRKEAFESSYLESVTMPDSVTTLGTSAFRYAGNLTQVTLSVNITDIPEYAFQGAGTYTVGESDGLGTYDSDFSILQGMKVSFNGSASSSKLKTIGGSAFNASTLSDGTFLKDLKNLKEIGSYAFSYTDFQEIVIPSCVETIGTGAFQGMYYLTTVTFADGSHVTELPDSLFGSSQASESNKTYADLVLKEVQLPEGVQTIGADCFGNCYSLETVGYKGEMIEGELHFPDSLQEIKERAFENCGSYVISDYDETTGEGYTSQYCGIPIYTGGFRKVVIPDSVTTLGEGVFQNCIMMEELLLGNGLEELPANLCKGCGSYPYKEAETGKMSESDIVITITPDPDSSDTETKTEYKGITFVGLKMVKLPENLLTIGNAAFSECYALEDFYDENGNAYRGEFPSTLETIGTSAFQRCKKLKTVVFPSSLKEIGDSAFAEDSIDVAESTTSRSTKGSVSYYHQYEGLSKVDFNYATNLESIGSRAFARTKVSAMQFPKALKKISSGICEDCYNLSTVTIDEETTEIGDTAFRNTYNLETVTLPLSAVWSTSIFAGVAGMAKKQLVLNAAPSKKSTNVYVGKDNVLDFNCLKNFNTYTLTVTDEDADVSDDANNLLSHDSNEFVAVQNDVSNQESSKQVILEGKKIGVTTLRISAAIPLEGDRMAQNNSTALNDAALTLQISQLYNINVTQNPISVLELSADRLAEEAKKQVLYLRYGSDDVTKLTASYMAEDSTEYTTDTIDWNMENSSVAAIVEGSRADSTTQAEENKKISVSEIGIKPVSLGDTVLSIKSSGDVTRGECNVKVRLALSSLSLSETSKTVDVGKEFTLSVDQTNYSEEDAKILAQYPEYGDVWRFTSDDESVATVDSVSGKVTPVADGETVITVTSLVSGAKAACLVSVKTGYVPPALSVELSQKELEMYVGDSPVALQAKVLPEDASQIVEWSSSDTDVATVSSGIITVLKQGNVTITAKTEDGKSADCRLTVKQHVESLKLEKSTLLLEVGKSQTLKTEILPENATDKKITWTSANEEVATVDDSGSVTAKKAGETTITAMADGISATCVVTVKEVAESVTISATDAVLQVGQSRTLTASVMPAGAAQEITWKSSDDAIATVENGVVKAKKEGTCTITATSVVGEKRADCVITVIPKMKITLKSVKNVKKGAVKVKWKAIAGVTGYQVACGSKKKITTANSLTFKRLKKKKKYIVKVRAYTEVSGKKVYGAWSKKKKVKIKK